MEENIAQESRKHEAKLASKKHKNMEKPYNLATLSAVPECNACTSSATYVPSNLSTCVVVLAYVKFIYGGSSYVIMPAVQHCDFFFLSNSRALNFYFLPRLWYVANAKA